MKRIFCRKPDPHVQEESCVSVDISQSEEVRMEKERKKKLFQAIQEKDVDAIKKLIREGLNIKEAKDEHQRSALHSLVDLELINPKDIEILEELFKLFVEENCSVDDTDKYGNTPIKLAAEKENIRLMQLLVDSGADVNKPDKSEDTPLHWAAKKGKVKAVLFLVSNKAHVDVQNHDEERKTPLHLAVEEKHKNVVLLLLHLKANQTLRDKNGYNPCKYADIRHVPEIKDLFKISPELIQNKEWMVNYARENNFDEVVKLFADKPPVQNKGNFVEVVTPDSPPTPSIGSPIYNIYMSGNASAAIGDGASYITNQRRESQQNSSRNPVDVPVEATAHAADGSTSTTLTLGTSTKSDSSTVPGVQTAADGSTSTIPRRSTETDSATALVPTVADGSISTTPGRSTETDSATAPVPTVADGSTSTTPGRSTETASATAPVPTVADGSTSTTPGRSTETDSATAPVPTAADGSTPTTPGQTIKTDSATAPVPTVADGSTSTTFKNLFEDLHKKRHNRPPPSAPLEDS